MKNSLGICGPYALSCVLEKSLSDVIQDWIGGYHGFAPFHKVMEMLDFYKVKYQRVNGHHAKTFHGLPQGVNNAIARIQWEGDYKHWAEAQKFTHYVAVKRVNGEILIYSDELQEQSPFKFNSTQALDYLKDGYITSYLYIQN